MILILGAGWLGKKYHEYFKDSILSLARINSVLDALRVIEQHEPSLVLSCIGKTGEPNVDWCESHQEETWASNVTAQWYIAQACRTFHIRSAFLGSGCIYRGGPFTDDDSPNFFGSYYSRTKLAAEKMLEPYDTLVIRPRMPIDASPSKRNLITKLIGYREVINLPNSVTCVPDLMRATEHLFQIGARGVYNVVQKLPITHQEILAMYKEIVDGSFQMPQFVHELHTEAERSNCVLMPDKLERSGFEVQEVRTAVRACLEAYA